MDQESWEDSPEELAAWRKLRERQRHLAGYPPEPSSDRRPKLVHQGPGVSPQERRKELLESLKQNYPHMSEAEIIKHLEAWGE
jgi:hypothetical protein